MTDKLPQLVVNYILYCRYRKNAITTGKIDLSQLKWIYPTTLLPLSNFISENNPAVVEPEEPAVSSYLSTILNGGYNASPASYVPIVKLPKEYEKAERVVRALYALNEEALCGGVQAYRYVLGEIIDNIYEHSNFTNALVMAQRYQTKRIVELCFFDNGISIPGRMKTNGLVFKDDEAIVEAVRGLSTKSEERGQGLQSTNRLVTDGLNGKILIVSRCGALYLNKNTPCRFELSEELKLNGTLLSVRIPFSAAVVDIYDYISGT